MTVPPDLRRPPRVRRARSQATAVLAAERELVARRPEKLVVRVDRTDPSKNIVRALASALFEPELDAHPEMHKRVGMLALLDPSRQDIPEYAEYLGAIQREARRGQRPLPAGRLGRRSTSRSRTTSSVRSPPTSSSTRSS